MSNKKEASKQSQKTEREIWEEQEAARKADVERRRAHPQLEIGGVRFYQADDASEAPGAWYAIVHHKSGPPVPDVRLHPTDSKYLHDLAERLLGKK